MAAMTGTFGVRGCSGNPEGRGIRRRRGFPAARTVGMDDALLHAGQHGEVDAGAEVIAGAAQMTTRASGVASIHSKAWRFLPHGLVDGVRRSGRLRRTSAMWSARVRLR